MDKMEIRPRFHYNSSLTPEEVLYAVQQSLAAENAPVKGSIVDHHIFLKIPAEDQHFWSPQLSLEVEADESGSVINGLFGPRESVWLMYLFFYALLGFMIMIVMIMGFSQLNLGLSARILWVLPVLFFLLILAYFTAKTGQKLGEDEMGLLYSFFLDSVQTGAARVSVS